MTIKALYPTVRPTLNLDFAKTKALDPRVTFTRASTATFVGADGLIQTAASGAARFDHNPTTGESLGLLVEEARTNNALNSADAFAGSTTVNSTYASATAVSPDGTTSVRFLQETTAAGNHRIEFNSGAFTGAIFSVFVKPAGRFRFRFHVSGTSGSGGIFNVQTGAISYTGSAGNGRIDAYSNGWYRLSVGLPIAGDNRGDSSFFGLLNDSGTESYTGDGTSGAYLWGIQRETGSFPTSYIPTVASTVTRAADVASMTGTNFSSWFNASSGSFLFAQKTPTTLQTSPLTALYLVSAATGSPNNGYYVSNTLAPLNAAGAYIWSTSYLLTGLTANSFAKLSFGYTNGSAAVAKDGVIQGTNTQALAAVSPATLSLAPSATATIARLAYYPVRLADAQLQALTAT